MARLVMGVKLPRPSAPILVYQDIVFVVMGLASGPVPIGANG